MKMRLALALMLMPLVLPTAAPAAIVFDGTPGTGAPPPTLGGFTMQPFPLDPRPLTPCPPCGTIVSDVAGPTGKLGFSPPQLHTRAGIGIVGAWSSHPYSGDVYHIGYRGGYVTTITLPAGTRAFSLYAVANEEFAPRHLLATAQDGTTSGPVVVTYDRNGGDGAKYFGFYTTGSSQLRAVTVTLLDGPAVGPIVGEFFIAGTQGCTVKGTERDDTLTGTEGPDRICGFGGNDVISGLGGNDVIAGGSGDDDIRGDAGHDTINGGPGDDTLAGGAGSDTILGFDGNDLLDGGDLNDVLFGQNGDDTLLGGAGNDRLDGGADTDTCDQGTGRGPQGHCEP